MPKLKVNLHGEIWSLKRIVLEEHQKMAWTTIAEKLKKPLHLALVDPFFYHYLNDRKIKSADSIKGTVLKGLLNTTKNQIEIWYDGKKVQKLKINDLDNDQLLFPLFISVVTDPIAALDSGIYIEQKEIGFYGSFEMADVQHFRIDKLQFNIMEYKNSVYLKDVIYDQLKFKFKPQETTVIFQDGFVVE
jgi:hypothetical protein